MYISGENCYLNYNKPEYAVSDWQFLEVPIDYQSNSSERTKISYRLSANFSPDKKTIIYFNGGPGGTSFNTDFNMLDDVNVIYFNQRGAAFSRPESQELFLNQDYYSSENTARDALEIIKHLQINQVTAYGMSYGTVPATIFGSLFPERTRNVILEGVVFDGQSRLWFGLHRIKLLQRYFDHLDDEFLKNNILKYSHHPEVFSGWFSSLAQRLMYDANFEKNLTATLKSFFYPDLLLTSEENEKLVIEKLKSFSYRNPGTESEMIWYSSTLFSFIACKELDAKNELSNFYSIFNEQKKLIPYQKPPTDENYCQKLNITKSETYSAVRYPIQVPVYYFQGTTDGATTAEYAVWHYKKSAKSRAELILAKQVGHVVAIQYLTKSSNLSESDKKQIAKQTEIVKIFKSAINNESIDLSKLNQLMDDKNLMWVKTQKNYQNY